MFKIADGREHFYQWDLDRQIIVEDPTITEVHFCNRTDDCSLVVEVNELEIFADAKPISVLRTANVPNIILQKNFDIRVFGYDGKATRYDKVFEVKSRTKPADYVYTETEVKNFETLQNYIDERLDKIAEEGITVDLTGYATEEYVDKAIEAIPEPEKTDLTGYAKEQWVKDQGYLTQHQDLSDYATHTELNAVSKSIPTKVSQLSNDKGYLTQHQDISHLATNSKVQAVENKIPTKVSQLTNDRGYLTEHQSLDGYATEKYVDDAIAGIELPEAESQKVYNLDLPTYKGSIVTDADTIEFLDKCLAGEHPLAFEGNFIITRVQKGDALNSEKIILSYATNAILGTGSEIYYDYHFIKKDGSWTLNYYNETSRSYSADYATKGYVDNAIQTALSGIATAEGGEY